MRKLLLLLWIVPFLGFRQTIDTEGSNTLDGHSGDYFLNTSSTAQTKSGQLTLSDSLIMSRLASSNTLVLSPTATGNTDTLETSVITAITLSSVSVDSVGVNSYLIVDGVYNYAADAQADDDYEVTIPGITALVAGLQITFKANTANTGGATLEITSVGDLDAILKMHDQALATNDIEAGQIVVVIFDGTNWQMTSQIAQ